MTIVTDRYITASMTLIALPGWGGAAPAITITGPAPAVVAAVGRLAGLSGAEDTVVADLRRCPVHDTDWLIVDARQAESYPAFLAEVDVLETSAPASEEDVITVGARDAKEMPSGSAEAVLGGGS